MDPAKEYESRLADWSRKAQASEQGHRRMGDARLLFVLALLVFAAALCRSQVSLGLVWVMVMVGLFLTGLAHDRVLRARDFARRSIRFYKTGLDRINGKWAGKGSPGTEFLDSHHPYAADLDVFGSGSLFELLNTAQTRSGRAILAAWLLAPATPDEIRGRQTAVDELRLKLDMREQMGQMAAEAEAQIRTDSMIEWSQRPRVLKSNLVRWMAFFVPALSLVLFCAGQAIPFVVVFGAQLVLAGWWRKRVRQVTRSLNSPVSDLKSLAALLRRLETESFRTERLQELQAGCRSREIAASEAIRRLARLHDWLDSRENLVFAGICAWWLWETQFAFAIEAWRARFGDKVELWLKNLGEMEALSSLAGYAFEHPADPFPELIADTAGPLFEASDLGHPLIVESKAVTNGALLDSNLRLVVVSGSNMSGKSTYLRTIGVNVVLAMSGAPVRARALRLTALQVGASIRTLDSLQEGMSRFYAEITRLRDLTNLALRKPTLLFLLDEILGGTNSHDRRVGAAAVVRSLLQRGALGLITTHDLALTQIVNEVQPPGANVHFEDQLTDGRISFDFKLRPGIVEKSNALELMRSIGLEVRE